MTRAVRARIDRSALRHNLERARKAAPGSRVMAVIKADAYGHGLVETARSLEAADAFAVEDAGEGIRLRDAGVTADIVLLSGFHDAADIDIIARHRLTPVLHDHWQVAALAEHEPPATLGAWVKLDSGMHRAGFEIRDLGRVLERLASLPTVRIEGLMSHLACADDLGNPATTRQRRRLEQAAAGLSLPLSLANSPGVLGWPETHLDWIRPGMMLYGCSPIQGRGERDLDLCPAMIFESQLIATRTVAAGERIGYGGTWRCGSDTRVGLLACGYGDGYPRHAPSGTPVRVNGRASRVLGRISMDLMSIDLSRCAEAAVGDWTELWGTEVSASDVAAHVGTIPYELVTRVAARVPRIYD